MRRVACETHLSRPASCTSWARSRPTATSTSRRSRARPCARSATTAQSTALTAIPAPSSLHIDEQSADIALGVDKSLESKEAGDSAISTIGAGDQGMMFGYRLRRDAGAYAAAHFAGAQAGQAPDRRAQAAAWSTICRPDGKTPGYGRVRRGQPPGPRGHRCHLHPAQPGGFDIAAAARGHDRSRS